MYTTVFHFDKSKQYLSRESRSHQQNHTIIAQISCGCTSQQNGMKMHILVEVALHYSDLN